MNAHHREARRQKIAEAVARLIFAKREALDLSMSQVAQRAGISQQMVSYVERGMRMPTLDTLLRITDALETSLPALLRKAGAP
jgi:transcriptional regulator with XRE-family HTH domain